jgi:hypothetical protein
LWASKLTWPTATWAESSNKQVNAGPAEGIIGQDALSVDRPGRGGCDPRRR